MIGVGLFSIFKREHGFYRCYKLYLEINKNPDIKIRNLNELLIQKLLANDELRDLFTDGTTITFSQGVLMRDRSDTVFRLKGFSKPEDSVETIMKKYTYRVTFFDVTRGTVGEVFSNCVYNHDEDFYYKKILVNLIKPNMGNLTYIIEDSTDTIDI